MMLYSQATELKDKSIKMQERVIHSTSQDLLVIAPRQTGKTHAVMERIMRGEEESILIVVPNKSQLNIYKDMLSKVAILKRLVEWGNLEGYEITDYMQYTKGVILVTGDKLNTLHVTAGINLYIDLLIVDEGDYVSSDIIKDLMEGRDVIIDKTLVIGTPEYASPKQHTCMGELYYSEAKDIEKVIY